MEHIPRRSDAESGPGVTGGVTGGGPGPDSGSDAARAPITPLDLPQGCHTVTLFGGTFDPPHRWHMRGPMPIARALGACLVVVPAAKNPLKVNGPIASDQDRVAMVKLALDAAAADAPHHYGLRVWTDEIDRAAWARQRGITAPSYTIDTVRRLREVIDPKISVRMVIGVDQALKFHEWRSYRELLGIVVQPIVLPRDGVTTRQSFAALLRAQGALSEDDIGVLDFCEGIPLEPISSTQIRAALKRGDPTPDLDPSVRAYIDERGLYR